MANSAQLPEEVVAAVDGPRGNKTIPG